MAKCNLHMAAVARGCRAKLCTVFAQPPYRYSDIISTVFLLQEIDLLDCFKELFPVVYFIRNATEDLL